MKRSIGLGLVVFVVFASSIVLASESQWLDPKQAEQYWDSEHFKNAKPLQLPMGPAENIQRQLEMQVPKNLEGTKLLQGSDFPAKWIRQPKILFDLDDTKSETSTSPSILYDAGADTPNAPFSSARVNPLFTGQNWYFSADANSPFRRTGMLFFTIPGVGDATCTASIIQARILLTAGHCLHEGNGQQSGFHTNYSFVPAFRDTLHLMVSGIQYIKLLLADGLIWGTTKDIMQLISEC